ncbi:MAG TPA: ferredoxin family protein [Candidatus Bathyarchaeia archaeon]
MNVAKDEKAQAAVLEVPKAQPKALVVVVPELCKGCELCIYACPSGNLVLNHNLNRKGYHPVVFSYQGTRGPCSACGICYWVCPDLAIAEVRRLKQ